MATLPKSLPDAGKPDAAVPLKTECDGEPGAFTPGPAYQVGPTQIEPTIDGALYLAAEILWPEPWAPAHNRDLWQSGPDGTYGEQWKNDATGWSFE